ncbi:SHOCT domain-containing protein [Aliarcobacter cryaerophilus]|uniref:SHOCT domain-containing protein n=1 Tax=Aliarcobacter cryaerophilus TaxID=28198 RepID=A0A2S9TC12_9BACT|nr:SHOCT domain-containing protein [Aliarcobacter cryaerophilus]PRM96370.1 hypothetical protein CJ670_08895 [Arcobacter cryaerophilus gv. crypticus]
MKIYTLINSILMLLIFSGCSVKSDIKKVSESKSHFDNAIYTGQKDFYKNTENIEGEQYRIFHQAATGFTPTSTVRNSAMQRASIFCKNLNSNYNVIKISEHTGQPPYIFGNYPKIEIIFVCKEKKENDFPINEESKYNNLEKIKKLYDNGVLTEEEYLIEKDKLLNK